MEYTPSKETQLLLNTIRYINEQDYHHNYQELFSTLSPCPPLTEEEFKAILQERKQQGWITWVLEDTIEQDGASHTIIIATISMMIERKFYRQGNRVAHIEDVIVLPTYQHYKLGTAINNYAIQYAKDYGCYKVVLDCKEDLEKFYTLSGMQRNNVQMSKYFD